MKLSILIPVVIAGGLLVAYCGPNPNPPKDAAKTWPGGPSAPLLQNPLPVTPHAQEGYRTCWAACAEMTMEFLGGSRIRQCEQAGVAFGDPGCCVQDGVIQATSPCDKLWHPEFRTWGFDVDLVPNNFHPLEHLTWDELKTEINDGRPFLFGWIESPPITHIVVGVGYHEVGGEKMVFYLDPLADPAHEPIMASFSDYDGSSGVYPHKFDYFRIRPSFQ